MRRKPLFCALALLASVGGVSSTFGYLLEGPKWTSSTIPMVVQLGTPSFVLPDGNLDWNKDAENCFQIWNEQMRDSQFSWTEAPTSPAAAQHDGKNSVQFSGSVFGKGYGSGVLAVTTYFFSGSSMTEADVNFNTGINWSSGVVAPKNDFHRVALHEFGHVLGLDHPDQAQPPQSQAAIMHSMVGSTNTLTGDDVAGVQALYGPSTNVGPGPRLGNISTRGFSGTGDNVLIAGFILHDQAKPVLARALGPTLSGAGVAGALSDPTLSLYNQSGQLIFSNDNWADAQGTEIQQTGLAPPDSREAAIKATLAPGNYTAILSGKGGATGIGLAEVYDLSLSSGIAYNISTRGFVGTGENVLIAGFIAKGPEIETVIIRGIGPGLQGTVPGVLPDTKIELRNSNGQLITSNVGWQNDPNSALLSFYGLAPGNAKDSALYTQLVPGNYTVIFNSPTNATGIGLVEVYDISN